MYKELEPLAGTEIPALKNFWSWVNDAFTPDYRREIDNYLSESSNHFDLENRISVLQRRGMI